MSKLRSVSTSFWSDPFIEDLTPNEKLLFLYLITNDKTNMLGIYEVSIKKISFDTGLNKDVIEKALKEFERLSKVKYIKNHIVLVNFMKHQNYNTNMKKSAIGIYNELPNELKNKELSISKDNPLKGFETLCNTFGMVPKVEYEVEYEEEEEIELEKEEKEIFLLEKETKEENLSKENPTEIFSKSESVEPGAEERKKVAQKKEIFKPPTVQEVQDYCNERQNEIQAYTFVNFYQSKGWKVGNQPMKDWKAAVRTWEQKNKQNGITNTTNTGFSTSKPSTNNGNSGKRSYRQILAERLTNELKANGEGSNITIDAEICE